MYTFESVDVKCNDSVTMCVQLTASGVTYGQRTIENMIQSYQIIICISYKIY